MIKRSLGGAMLLFILCTIPATLTLWAQTATTSLRGTVKDPSGAVVSGATVTITDAGTGKSFKETSSSSGYYQFSQIPPAKYKILISAPGFGDQSRSAELLVNQPATINVALTVQSSVVTVDVSAAAQTLNTTDATLGDSVGNQTIQALPMEGRDPIALLTLQPGVLYLGNPSENATVDSRSGSVNGGRSDQGNITLDGMDDNDQVGGTAFTGVLRSTLDSTEEFRVTTSNGNADTGRSSGAQVTLVTKSGTNRFHGSLYEYYRPTNTVANAWFNKNQQLSDGDPNIPQKYVQNVFGGTASGPILKDKLFFFFNYEGKRQAISNIVTKAIPTAQFYQGELGYKNTSGSTVWLPASSVASLDALCNPAQTGVACGVNQNVLDYYQPLNAAGLLGTSQTAGDGVNSAGYTFTSPAPLTNNTSIARIDYNINNKMQLFVRGNLQKDLQGGNINLPGQPSASWTEDNTKGITAGHTWTPTSHIVNDLRYAYVRQGYSTRGIGSGQGDWVDFEGLTQPESQTLSTIVSVPVHNITDSLTWTKGNHTFNFGGNWRNITNNRGTDANSYSNASTDPNWMVGTPPAPTDLEQGFTTSYKDAYATLMGTVGLTSELYNYSVVRGQMSATLLSDGAFIDRHFRANEFEWFVQDSWRVKPNLTLTYGVRHSILQTPYETKGQEVAPTVDTHLWFEQRGWDAAKGISDQTLLQFAPAGKANGRPGYWSKQKLNFAPRLAAVYSFNPRTTLRVGGGMYFDHFGQGIVNSFDENGSYGLSSQVMSPASYYGYTQDPATNSGGAPSAPRFTGAHNIPSLPDGSTAPTTVNYPAASSNDPNTTGLAIAWGIDNHIKTPYSYSLDASLERQLPGGWTSEINYVGRLGRHLLQELDLAEPVNMVDTKGGGDYFHAAAQLSKLSDQHGGSSTATVPKITYFEDMFPYMANMDYAGESATQAIYTNEWTATRYGLGETQALMDLDFYGADAGVPFRFFNKQYSSLYAWSSIGTSSYHALQVSLRHPSSHGLTVDVSYTLSKSIDMGSVVERSNWESSDSFGGTSAIQNSWNPKATKGVSDYDTRNMLTLDWVYVLPVGRGKMLLGNSSKLTEIFLGGWQWSGLTRVTSALPFSVLSPGWNTDWNLSAPAVVTAPVKVHKHLGSGSIPQVFADADTINNGVYNGSPIRLPYPGEGGNRNYFRGDGYFDIDSSLAKTWTLPAQMKLKFSGEVYNVTNTARMDASPLNLNSQVTYGTLGYYSGTLSTYRRMQFGLRLDF